MNATAAKVDQKISGMNAVDDDYLLKALASANMNALRIALYHQTRDVELRKMTVDHVPVQGGALISHSLPRKFHPYIRGKAFEFIRSGIPAKPDPTK